MGRSTHRRLLAFIASVLLCLVTFIGLSRTQAQAAIVGEVVYEGSIAQAQDCEEDCGLRGDDDYSESIPIGFDFEFYGHTFTDVYLNINGVMHFGCPSSEYSNDTLPTDFDGSCDMGGDIGDTAPVAVLAFWDDIITTPSGLYCSEDPIVDTCDSWNWEGSYPTILYKTVGDPGSRKFIAQWTNMHLYSNPNVPLGTFQIILYEGVNEVQVQYRNLLGDPDRAQGSSATVGIQYNDSNYNEYSYEASRPLSSELAIRYVLGEGYSYNDEATYDPVYLATSGAAAKPVLTSPSNAATNVVLNPTLQWSAAANADNYSVTVASDSGFSSIVLQALDLTSTSYDIESLLEPATTYYWNVKASNELGDEYSEMFSFTTGSSIAAPDDDDDVDEAIEDDAPNSGDANDDGTPDSEQPKVTSLVSPVTNTYVVLESSVCTNNSSVSIVSEPANPDQDDDNYDYPFGLLDFTLTGCGVGATETITQYYYGNYNPSTILVRKYNATTHTYTVIPDAVVTQVTMGGQPAVMVVYTVVDGGALDTDGVANGTILDPAGIAVLGAVSAAPAAVPNTGLADSVYAQRFLTLLLIAGGLALVSARLIRHN